jgi:hypothetical protein
MKKPHEKTCGSSKGFFLMLPARILAIVIFVAFLPVIIFPMTIITLTHI